VANHFDRFNAFVRTGLMGRLTKKALTVYLSYLCRAGKDGMAWPSNDTLVFESGLSSERWIGQAKEELARFGLLTKLSDPKKGQSAKFRVEVAPNGWTPTSIDASVHRRSRPSTPTSELVDAHVRNGWTPTSEPPTPPYKEEHTIEETRNRPIELSASPKPVPSNPFTDFWDAWPKHFRKRGKPGCERFWKSKNLDESAPHVMKSLAWHKKHSPDWQKDGGQFIPMPSTWLHQMPWLYDMSGIRTPPPSQQDWSAYGPGFHPPDEPPRRPTSAELDEILGPPAKRPEATP
jgi:hypothetical protein